MVWLQVWNSVCVRQTKFSDIADCPLVCRLSAVCMNNWPFISCRVAYAWEELACVCVSQTSKSFIAVCPLNCLFSADWPVRSCRAAYAAEEMVWLQVWKSVWVCRTSRSVQRWKFCFYTVSLWMSKGRVADLIWIVRIRIRALKTKKAAISNPGLVVFKFQWCIAHVSIVWDHHA